jgi:SAM-dependent methyltransferase
VGVDASLNLLRICKKHGRASRLVCAELEHLPFKDGLFDRAVSVRVLQHIREQGQAVADMARVLAPGGEITLQCYNDLSSKGLVKRLRQSRLGSAVLNAPFRLLFRTMSPFGPWELEYDQYNTVPQVRRWLRDAGVRVTKVRGTGFGFNKWLLAGFMVAPWLEKHRPEILKRYLAVSLRAEEALGRHSPFSSVMEKFVLQGVKVGATSARRAGEPALVRSRVAAD